VRPDDAATTARPRVAPLLVFAVGNPSRGDDALGPTLAHALRVEEEFADAAHAHAELLEVVQLQIEDALALEGRSAVLFIDAEHVPGDDAAGAADAADTAGAADAADAAGAADAADAAGAAEVGRRIDGVCLRRVHPARAAAFTHALEPGALLQVAQRVLDAPLPPAWVLAIGASAFELGAPLSAAARARLPAALALARAWLAAHAGVHDAHDAQDTQDAQSATPAGPSPGCPQPRA